MAEALGYMVSGGSRDKTTICHNISDIEYYDCELPRVRRILEDPEAFLDSKRGQRIALDEIHRLDNPSELLKIAADHYKDIKVIATGSSTLSASKKFKDTLTGRKVKIWLSPMLFHENKLFGNYNFEHRLSHGGLPPFYNELEISEIEFQEWIDDYWAKDIQELFDISSKSSFQRFTELVLAKIVFLKQQNMPPHAKLAEQRSINICIYCNKHLLPI